MIRVQLSAAEARFGMVVGCGRLTQDLYEDLEGKYGSNKILAGHRYEIDIVGAVAEMVVAKALNKFWAGQEGNFQAADVGHLQVRGTERQDGCLIVHPPPPMNKPKARGDKPGDIFVLVVGLPPYLWIPGWCYGHEAQQPKWWRGQYERPAYFVRQSALRPFNTLGTVVFTDEVVDLPREPQDPTVTEARDNFITV